MINSGFITTSRLVALGTVGAAVVLGVTSGVFGSWSAQNDTTKNCTALTTDSYGYGYGYAGAVGYGFECTPKSSTTTTVTGGGGGGGGSSAPITPVATVSGSLTPTVTTQPTVPAVSTTPSVILFPKFVTPCGTEALNLTDAIVTSSYKEFGVINTTTPNRALTRAEFLKLTLNAAGVDVSKETAASYSDVPATHTLNKYIAYATRNGIVSGLDGKFRPDDVITRAESMKIIVRGTNMKLSATIDAFADVANTNSLAPYVQTAFDNCIVHGRRTVDGETTLSSGARVFEPGSAVTLAETIKILVNVTK